MFTGTARTKNEFIFTEMLGIVVHENMKLGDSIACENRRSPRSSPLEDISRGGTSATQQQKFHTVDVGFA